MKSLFLGSVLVMAVVACVDQSPAPPPTPKEASTESEIGTNTVWWCSNYTDGCISVSPLYPGPKDECIELCQDAGVASPRCVLVRDPC
jgi:hypothetical protein